MINMTDGNQIPNNTALTITEVINSAVRPGITFMIAGTLCYLAIRNGVSISGESLLAMAGTVLGFWFSSKQNENTVKQMTNSLGLSNPATVGTVVNNVQASPDSSSDTASNSRPNPARDSNGPSVGPISNSINPARD